MPGTFEVASDVIAARAVKPVHTFIEDIGASAAFWILSGSSFISANEMAHVGSIGTFAVLHDMSELANKEGIKVIVIAAGEMKAAGFYTVSIHTMSETWTMASAEQLWSQVQGFSPGLAFLFDSLNEDQTNAMGVAFLDELRGRFGDGPVMLDMEAHIAVATKRET